MAKEFPKFIAAAVQASPVFMDKDKTIEKGCSLIAEAARNGARLIVFPEAWIPAFPYWGQQPGQGWALVWRDLLQNSVEIPSSDTDILCRAARQANAYVAIGMNERDKRSRGTIYNTILFLDNKGNIMGRHRKLVPWTAERLYWGRGDGSDLRVFETEFGGLGGLICGEHFMTLSKYALWAKGEQIHCAPWPGQSWAKALIDVACRSYAMEGQVWVIVANNYITADMIPDDFLFKQSPVWSVAGGSGIINPRSGRYIAGPVYDQETIVYGEIDMGEVALAKAYFDVVGHWARWDVANLNLNEEHYVPYHSMPGRSESSIRRDLRELAKAVEELAILIREKPHPELAAVAEALRDRIRALGESSREDI